MRRLTSQLRTTDAGFKTNTARMRELVDELRDRVETARLGGPEHARKLHTERGKLLPRERVERLIDPGTPFLEL